MALRVSIVLFSFALAFVAEDSQRKYLRCRQDCRKALAKCAELCKKKHGFDKGYIECRDRCMDELDDCERGCLEFRDEEAR